jgi:hypothetical protein
MADAMWKQVHGQSERIDHNPSNTLRQGQTTRLSGTCKNCLEGKATCLRKRADSSSGSAQQVKACWAHGDAWLTQCGSRYMVNPIFEKRVKRLEIVEKEAVGVSYLGVTYGVREPAR